MATTRNFIVLYAFFSFVFCASVAEIYADTHTATSCSLANVSAAVTAASRGDTVSVPAGSCTWSGRLNITKGLHIKGAGIGNIVITGGIDYHPDATAISNDERFEVEGFTFNGGVGIGIYNSNQKPITNVVIHHNRLQNNSSKVFDVIGNIYGVAYLNQLSNHYTVNFLGNGDSSWNNPFAYGDAKNFYMEDNIFTDYNNNANGTMWIESGQGGRYTLRYNTFNASGYTHGIDLWDIHGDQGDAGGLGGELYGNALINTNGNGGYRWLCHRGGSVLTFYNKNSGTAGLGFDLQENHQCGPQQILNTYYWANFEGTTLLAADVTNDCCDCLQQNRDWFTQPASFNGTVGVGCGTLTSRPATCTTGVGYWATNQSCTDMTGLIGDITTYPTRQTITGTLYKCTSTNTWTAYYTPYTYPHPLRQETDGPKPPTNLRIISP
jgi:hypothetical protein